MEKRRKLEKCKGNGSFKFERRLSAEVRQQEKSDIVEEKTLGEGSCQGNIQQKYCIGKII